MAAKRQKAEQHRRFNMVFLVKSAGKEKDCEPITVIGKISSDGLPFAGVGDVIGCCYIKVM
jgi:hypothetical protein